MITSNATDNRDYLLDFSRTLLLAYVVCVIHPVYWLHNGVEPYKSIILFEMPLIFFIAGAAANLAGYQNKTFIKIFNSRFKRILIPYIVFVIISFIGMAALRSLLGLDLFAGTCREYVSAIILGQTIPGLGFSYHLWFIPVYFLISISTSFQLFIISKVPNYIYIGFCVLLWALSNLIAQLHVMPYSISQLTSQVFLYNIFYISGFLYYKKLNKTSILALAVIMVVALIMATKGDLTGMQTHKFSQDYIFLLFGTCSLLIFSLLISCVNALPYECLLSKAGLDRWNKYGFSIYLWQNWSFIILYYCASYLYIPVTGKPIYLVWEIPLLYLISWGLSFIIMPIEDFIVRCLYKSHPKPTPKFINW